MKEGLLSIGCLSEIDNVTIQTPRHHDAPWPLSPAYTDPESGYRNYTPDQDYRLDMIQYRKELGMTPTEVTRVFQNEDLALIESIPVRKRSRELSQQSRNTVRVPLQEKHPLRT